MLLPSGNDITEESPVLMFVENDGDDESLSQSAGECYSPNPDYAIGVQSCSQLRCHRKETFTWMLNVRMCFLVSRDRFAGPFAAQTVLPTTELTISIAICQLFPWTKSSCHY